MLEIITLCLTLLVSGGFGDVLNFSDNTTTDPVKFHLFNRGPAKDGVAIGASNSSQFLKSVFLPDREVKVAVHGWLGSDKSASVAAICDVYVEERDVNSIAVDWSQLSGSIVYPVSALSVEQAGRALASLLDQLIRTGVTNLDNLHLIGHSLGAHVVGTAGSKMISGRPARITGLDPAGPGFEIIGELSPFILDKSDGQFVDVIHSAGGVAGYLHPLGHVDTYPNGGTPPQPGCLDLGHPLKIIGCSHSRSREFYVESIRLTGKKFRSVKCIDWNTFTTGACKTNEPVFMGDPVSNKSRGIFFLSTNSEPPYAQG